MLDARSLCKLTGVGKYRRCAAWGLHGSYNETLRVVCTGNILLLGGQITMVVFKICMVFYLLLCTAGMGSVIRRAVPGVVGVYVPLHVVLHGQGPGSVRDLHGF
jgi:hypothetical protein